MVRKEKVDVTEVRYFVLKHTNTSRKQAWYRTDSEWLVNDKLNEGELNNPDSKVHGAYLGPTGARWALCWPHEPCYQRRDVVLKNIRAPFGGVISWYYGLLPIQCRAIWWTKHGKTNININNIQVRIISSNYPNKTWRINWTQFNHCKFELAQVKPNYRFWRQYICQCSLQTISHFIQVSMC